MELFLFRHAGYERLYNCTALHIDSVPLERRQFIAGGIVKCVLCAIYYALYVPCMYSIWKHFHDNSCYKLLFYIGITDLGILWILGFYSGLLSLRGAVFCSSPTLMYLVGVAVTSLWIAETSADLVLALNRCLELGFAKLCRLLFSGHRIFAWFFACSLYALGWAVFIKPAVYSSVFFGWFFDPFVGYHNADDQQQKQHEEYEHWLHPVHNFLVAILSPLIYLVFALKLFYNVRTSRREFGVLVSELDSAQIRIFLQVLLISAMNTLTGSLYVYVQSHEVGQWMITLVDFSWFHVHGFPPVIYLALNKTIRADCRLLYLKLFNRHRIGNIGGVTVLRPILIQSNGTEVVVAIQPMNA
ncbi:hypothetical protein niasHT_012492 [Heterodera trifolii]|uniref:G protein-coupled receptor n=1 Tax=Heterodera trifolii TaxID=157864 RepID=A0ABD2KVA6_9BILA